MSGPSASSGSVSLRHRAVSVSGGDAGAREFQRVQLLPLSVVSDQSLGKVTDETKYWGKFTRPLTSQHTSLVKGVDFSPVKPHDLVVASGTRVELFDGQSRRPRKAFSRFKDLVHCVRYRRDGRLIAVGSEHPHVHVIDVENKLILRYLRGHQRAVHSVCFTPCKRSLLTGSDDKSLCLWDLSTGTSILHLQKAFTDYVRAVDCSPTVDSSLVCAGSYDHTVRIFDMRSGQASCSFNHGAPVESVLFHPTGGLVYSCGGNTTKVFDTLSGRKEPIAEMCNHQKTVTCLCLNDEGSRLLTGGLDHFVKIYDTESFAVVHSMYFPSPVLSIALSRENLQMAVGFSSGSSEWRIREVSSVQRKAEMKRKEYYRSGTYHYFMRGQSARPSADDFRIESVRRRKLQPYDQFLKEFRYSDALDAALATKNLQIVCSVVDELSARNGLTIALSGRDDTSLEPLLHFLAKNICNPNFSSMILDLANMVLDVYGQVAGQSVAIDELLFLLRRQVQGELKLHHDLLAVQGMLEVLFTASMQGDDDSEDEEEQISDTELGDEFQVGEMDEAHSSAGREPVENHCGDISTPKSLSKMSKKKNRQRTAGWDMEVDSTPAKDVPSMSEVVSVESSSTSRRGEKKKSKRTKEKKRKVKSRQRKRDRVYSDEE